MTNSHSTSDIGEVIKVKTLLAKENLRIPEYQRPYKWTKKHVQQLLSDIHHFKNNAKTTYRLGSIVFHKKDGQCNIVDGQQRIVTLLLLVHALKSNERLADKAAWLITLSDKLPFKSDISKYNIQENYREMAHLIRAYPYTEEHVEFLLERCEVVTFYLDDISEAFQFFDSQNARGRALEPHDLLKAYHLREFHSSTTESLKRKTVAAWEEIRTEKLAETFSKYLYRIRSWGRSYPARYFSKDDIGLFKGVNLEKTSQYPHLKQLRMVDYYTSHYNAHYMRQVDGKHMDFPFRLDQPIINGRRFFEMITHYHQIVEQVTSSRDATKNEQGQEKGVSGVYKAINNYEGRGRTGDGYVRCLFDCLMIYYKDKFGEADIDRATEKIFIWAYRLRLRQKRVSVAGMDKYALEEGNLFKLLKNAYHPSELINYEVLPLEEVTCSKAGDIANLYWALLQKNEHGQNE